MAITYYTVTFVSSGNGFIIGRNPQYVEAGGSTSAVTPLPANGYTFLNWSGDHVGTETDLTIRNVTSNMTIRVNFTDDPVHIPVPSFDLVANAQNRVLVQFRNSPVLKEIIGSITLEVQELMDQLRKAIQDRVLYRAVGYALAVIGRIVGQQRLLYSIRTVGSWFAPDLDEVCTDIGLAWLPAAGGEDTYVQADDSVYTDWIFAKLFKNFCQFASVLEIQQAALLTFNVRIAFQKTGPDTVDIILPASIEGSPIVDQLTVQDIDPRGEGVYMLPYPATISFSSIIYKEAV